MYEVNRNAEMFAKTKYVDRMPFARLSIMSVDVYADLDTMAIHWTMVSDVDHYRCRVANHPNVLLTRTVTIKFANLRATMIWNVL